MFDALVLLVFAAVGNANQKSPSVMRKPRAAQLAGKHCRTCFFGLPSVSSPEKLKTVVFRNNFKPTITGPSKTKARAIAATQAESIISSLAHLFVAIPSSTAGCAPAAITPTIWPLSNEGKYIRHIHTRRTRNCRYVVVSFSPEISSTGIYLYVPC